MYLFLIHVGTFRALGEVEAGALEGCQLLCQSHDTAQHKLQDGGTFQSAEELNESVILETGTWELQHARAEERMAGA